MSQSTGEVLRYPRSIDQSVVRDLDRSLRNIDSFEDQESTAVDATIGACLDAIRLASTRLTDYENQIALQSSTLREYETRIAELESQNHKLTSFCELARKKLTSEADRLKTAETLNREHEEYGKGLKKELDLANKNLKKIQSALGTAFGELKTPPAF